MDSPKKDTRKVLFATYIHYNHKSIYLKKVDVHNGPYRNITIKMKIYDVFTDLQKHENGCQNKGKLLSLKAKLSFSCGQSLKNIKKKKLMFL